MPHHHHRGRPKGAIDVPIQMKGALIALRLFFRLQFSNLESKTSVLESIAHHIYHWAIDDAGNKDFYNILASLTPKKEIRGRKPKIKNKSKLSKEIRHDIL
jgi:hypothetical protein